MNKKISNDKRIIDDNELSNIIKNSYDKGVIFGSKVTAGVVLKKLNMMTLENFDDMKQELVKFCAGVQKV